MLVVLSWLAFPHACGRPSPCAGDVGTRCRGHDHRARAARQDRAALAVSKRVRLASDDRSAGVSLAELEQLRAEVSELQGQLARANRQSARRRLGWRGPVSVLLIVLGCALAPISVLGVWTANQVSDTDRYVANVAPLIREPTVRGALTDKIAAAVSRQIDVQGVARQAATQLSRRGLPRLGALLSNFSGSIAGAVNGLIHSTVAKLVNRPLVARLWVQGNRAAHTRLVNALAGRESALSCSGGKVVISLGPLIDRVKDRLAARGLTLVKSLPPVNPTFPLFSAKYLVQARSAYRLLTTLKWVLPLLTLALLAAGIYARGVLHRPVGHGGQDQGCVPLRLRGDQGHRRAGWPKHRAERRVGLRAPDATEGSGRCGGRTRVHLLVKPDRPGGAGDRHHAGGRARTDRTARQASGQAEIRGPRQLGRGAGDRRAGDSAVRMVSALLRRAVSCVLYPVTVRVFFDDRQTGMLCT
jgi:hypothetical protein